MTKAALYVRVSTDDQDCGTQIRELTAWAERAGYEIAGIYQDTLSGAKKRPELERLLADARARRFDVVLCWKLDRFGRSPLDVLNQIEELKRLKIRWVATSQNFDTAGPVGQLLLYVLA